MSILYGHACGDPNVYPDRCERESGIGTGPCLYGTKQRSYLLDKYRSSGNILLLREFKNWLLSAMVQAIFLQIACPPPNINVCPSDDDPIFEERLNISIAALREVNSVFNATEICTCPCKKVLVKRVKASLNDAAGDPEGTIYIGKKEIKTSNNPSWKRVGGFGTTNFKSFDKRVDFGKALTARDLIKLKIIEDDSTSGDDEYEHSFGPDRWYENTCEPYDKRLEWNTRDGTIIYDLVIEPADDCPQGVSLKVILSN